MSRRRFAATLAVLASFLFLGACNRDASPPPTINPTFSVDPTSGPSGNSVTLTVKNALPGSTVTFSEQGAVGQVTAITNANGTATTTMIPQGEPGQIITYQAEIAPGTPNTQTLTATYTITE